MSEHDDTEPALPDLIAHDATETIFTAKIARQARGEQLFKREVRAFIRAAAAKHVEALQPAPVKTPKKRARKKPAPADVSAFGDPKKIPPTPEQVTAYSASIGYPLDGAKWCASYEAKGWKIGKGSGTPMKNWQATVINWRTNGYGRGTHTIDGNGAPWKDYSKI